MLYSLYIPVGGGTTNTACFYPIFTTYLTSTFSTTIRRLDRSGMDSSEDNSMYSPPHYITSYLKSELPIDFRECTLNCTHVSLPLSCTSGKLHGALPSVIRHKYLHLTGAIFRYASHRHKNNISTSQGGNQTRSGARGRVQKVTQEGAREVYNAQRVTCHSKNR